MKERPLMLTVMHAHKEWQNYMKKLAQESGIPYGQGFIKYADVYPLSTGTRLQGGTPFDNPAKPL